MDDSKVHYISKTNLSQQLSDDRISPINRYQAKVLGKASPADLLRYELLTFLFGNMPGALGYLLRKQSYPALFKRMGRGAILGKGLTIRHPSNISIGNHVAIDDYGMLDAPKELIVEDHVVISRNCVLQAKTGPVRIGRRTDIGCNAVITSQTGIYLGDAVLLAANCYIGGGRYRSETPGVPFMDQGLYSRGPVTIGDGSWLGAGAMVLDGVTVGKGCIVGSGSVVTKDIPDFSVVAGVPAKIIKNLQTVA